MFNKKDEDEAGEEKEDDIPPESNPLDRLRRNVIKTIMKKMLQQKSLIQIINSQKRKLKSMTNLI